MNDLLNDLFNQVIKDCSSGQDPLGNSLLTALCPIVKPISDCFRKVAANLYFTSEPKSEGKLWINLQGELLLKGNYLTHPQDLEDAMRGVANLVRVIGSGVYEGVMEPGGPDSCPLLILNGLANVIADAAMKGRQGITEEEVKFVR